MLIGPADDLEERLGVGFRKGDISESNNHQKIESLEVFKQSLKPLFLPVLHQLYGQIGGCEESMCARLNPILPRGIFRWGYGGSSPMLRPNYDSNTGGSRPS